MNFGTLLLIPIMIINLGMGLVMLLRGKQAGVTRPFSVSSFAIIFWALGSFLLLVSKDQLIAEIGLLLFFIAPMIATAFMPIFTKSFPKGIKVTKEEKLIVAGSTVALASAILVFPGFFTESLTITAEGQNVVRFSFWGFSLYATYLSSMFMWSYINLWLSLKNSSDYQRNQIIFSFVGVFLTSFLALITNVMLPLLGTTHLLWMGPTWAIFYVAFVGVAIVKYRLFDIRLVIARSIAYLLSLLFLVALYAFSTFLVASAFFPGETLSVGQQISYIVIALILAITFAPLKAMFDKLTRRIFYRDGYEIQEVLDQVSSSLVRTISLDELTKGIASVIDHAIRPVSPPAIIIDVKNKETYGKFTSIKKTIHSLKNRTGVILVDEMDVKSNELYRNLRSLNIAAIAPLREPDGDTIGFLVVTDKASGSIFSSQDIRLIKITASELAVAVQNSLHFEEIQRFNETLQEKVDAATYRLKRANIRLKQLDATKDEFVSMASHQLRTPLTSIKGYLSMVLDGDAGKLNPTQEKLLREAFTSSERMVRLIGDFLNISRLRTGRFVIERKPVDIAGLVQAEVEQLRPTARTRELSIEFTKPVNIPEMDLDKGKMQQVVMNLIDNAVFYSHPKDKIHVELYKDKTDIIFKVKDQGIGVPAAERRRLFTKFYRATNARKQRPDGTGIGLFMAQKVIIAHGGAVIFESTEGKGSTFGFRLPVELSEEAAARAAVIAEKDFTEA